MQKNKVYLADIISASVKKGEANLRLEELNSLIETYGGFEVFKVFQKKYKPGYELYIGTGKADEIFKEVLENDLNFVIINNQLKSHQIWSLQEVFEKIKAEYIKKHDEGDENYPCKVNRDKKIEIWDRMDLILKIFQKHAKTSEALLEIELAGLRHMGPRIYGMGLMLSKQGGGIGARGSGESNVSMMRTHLKQQEQKIKEQIQQCQRIKKTQRSEREKRGLKTVAIVGYTNAGKSHTLNSLTNKDVYVADKLFATLDTRIGNLFLPRLNKICLISDTIGFIQDLPPELINSFKSTLDETINANLLLQVVDISDEMIFKKIRVVTEILKDLKISSKVLYVFNKIDLLDESKLKEIKEKIFEKIDETDCLFISAKNNIGLDKLVEKIEDIIE